MRMKIMYKSAKPYAYADKPKVCSTGGYTISKDGRTVMFDFMESCGGAEVKDGYLYLDFMAKNIEIYSENGEETLYSDDGSNNKIKLNPCLFKGLHIDDFTEVFYECFLDSGETVHIEMKPIEISFFWHDDEYKVSFTSDSDDTVVNVNDYKVKVPYITVWDGGIAIETTAIVDIRTGEVTDIEPADVEGLEVCEREYIVMNDEQVSVFYDEDALVYRADINNNSNSVTQFSSEVNIKPEIPLQLRGDYK